jgi:hypothetical protein
VSPVLEPHLSDTPSGAPLPALASEALARGEYAAAVSPRQENIAASAFESVSWNIANWNRVS